MVLEFDKYGVLKNKKLYDKNNMKKISFAKKITENEIRKENFIYSFLSSVRQKMESKKKVDENMINEAKYKQTYKSITARDKDSRRIWGSQIGHPRVKVTSWSEVGKTGRMKTAYIEIEGDKDWVDA